MYECMILLNKKYSSTRKVGIINSMVKIKPILKINKKRDNTDNEARCKDFCVVNCSVIKTTRGYPVLTFSAVIHFHK